MNWVDGCAGVARPHPRIHPPINSTLAFEAARHWSRRRPAGDGGDRFAGQEGAEFRLRVAAEELAQVLAGAPVGLVAAEEALDGGGDLRGRAAVADLAGDALELADGAAQEEVVSVRHLAVHLH